jgi:hypothetical protein
MRRLRERVERRATFLPAAGSTPPLCYHQLNGHGFRFSGWYCHNLPRRKVQAPDACNLPPSFSSPSPATSDQRTYHILEAPSTFPMAVDPLLGSGLTHLFFIDQELHEGFPPYLFDLYLFEHRELFFR